MNAVGWLAGGGSAPLVIGLIAERSSLGFAITLTSLVYLMAAILLLLAIALSSRVPQPEPAVRTTIG